MAKKAAKTKPKKKKTAPAQPTKPKRAVFKKMKVNFWRTRLHDEELGIHQQLKYQAKTRYFSKNFDAFLTKESRSLGFSYSSRMHLARSSMFSGSKYFIIFSLK